MDRSPVHPYAARIVTAYLVLSHTDPPLVARLVDRLLRGDPDCVVVVDHQADGPPLSLTPSPRLHLRRSARPGGWGGFGLVAAVLDALVWMRSELDPDWVVLLSGQDYPAVPPAQTAARLRSDGHDAYVELWHDLAGPPATVVQRWWHARYFFRWSLTPLNLPARGEGLREGLQRRISFAQPWVFIWSLQRGGGTRIGLRRRRTPFGPGFTCRGGSQWFALSRKALASVIDQVERRPEIVRHYRRTLIPDESFFNTLIANDPDLRLADSNLHFWRFDGPGDSHAAVLEPADLPAIERSGRPFVRKVDADGELVAELDRRIGLSDG